MVVKALVLMYEASHKMLSCRQEGIRERHWHVAQNISHNEHLLK